MAGGEWIQDVSCGPLACAASCLGRVKLFFVLKKDNSLRLIVDCRRSNQHFVEAPRSHLFSGPSFAEVHISPEAQLWFSAIDVQNAFYQHVIPTWMSEVFAMDPLPAGSLGIETLEGTRVHPRTNIYPQLAYIH